MFLKIIGLATLIYIFIECLPLILEIGHNCMGIH